MKKITFVTIVLALALTACGSSSNQNQSSAQGQQNNRPLSPQLLLAVGIFKLEGTPQAVNAKEAAQLLPLWQLYGQLSTSSSSAPQEVTAVLDQIKGTLTAGQMNAITAMNLTNQEAFAFMQEQGMSFGGPGANGTPEANRTPRAGGGGFPGGGFGGPGGPGGAPGGGGSLNPSQIATAQARRAQGGGFSSQLPAPLLEALIKLLQSKITP